MKLIFKQRFFSWFDSYDIYNPDGEIIFIVEGKLSWGHCLKIYDGQHRELGTVKERVLTFLPQFEMYLGDRYLGCIRKELTFWKPRFQIDCNGWSIDGDWMEWDYRILDTSGHEIAFITKEVLHLTDTYVLDIANPQDALAVLMLVLAIDAEKCSRGD